MRRVGLGGGAGCYHAVVARHTVIDDAGMIEYGRLEVAARDVADTAILGGHNVVGFVNFSSR